MPKITFIGAGSVVFTKNVLSDCFSYPELQESTVTLFDIDPDRLAVAGQMVTKLAEFWGAHPTIETTPDPEEAFAGADYAINAIQVGRYDPCTITDFEIPKKYGLRQTIGDTLGIGGIMRALRTIPVMVEYCALMEDVCPDVTLLNYTNPMSMITWAILESSEINAIGLCHSVQGSYRHLAEALGLNADEVNWTCAGINHMAFYLTLEHNGVDLYPAILEKVASGEYAPDWDRVRLDMLQRLGYYITESSEHFSEYNPWYLKRDRPELVEKFNIPLDEYPRRCIRDQKWYEENAADLAAGKGYEDLKRSTEYASRIIHAMETGERELIHGSVLNDDLIDNLPYGCCVEVPVMVDKNGLQPVKVGLLPPQCAALNRSAINVQELTVYAALTETRENVYHAAMMDPHTAAELTLDEIWSMVDDLLAAHRDWLPSYLTD